MAKETSKLAIPELLQEWIRNSSYLSVVIFYGLKRRKRVLNSEHIFSRRIFPYFEDIH